MSQHNERHQEQADRQHTISWLGGWIERQERLKFASDRVEARVRNLHRLVAKADFTWRNAVGAFRMISAHESEDYRDEIHVVFDALNESCGVTA